MKTDICNSGYRHSSPANSRQEQWIQSSHCISHRSPAWTFVLNVSFDYEHRTLTDYEVFSQRDIFSSLLNWRIWVETLDLSFHWAHTRSRILCEQQPAPWILFNHRLHFEEREERGLMCETLSLHTVLTSPEHCLLGKNKFPKFAEKSRKKQKQTKKTSHFIRVEIAWFLNSQLSLCAIQLYFS